ncbi:MAG TPA: T9SS type A sorting domain-containing protein [Cytophagaceae bacterium]
MKRILTAVVLTLFTASFSLAQYPGQPLYGPGGTKDYIHQAVDSAFYGSDITNQFWLFEPASPKPATAYVVTYWHGSYDGPARQLGPALSSYVVEIVKKGYTVVVPLYQHGSYSPTADEKVSLFGSITKAAFLELDKPNHVKPIKDETNKVVYGTIGFSLGGMVFAGANNYKTAGIPAPIAIATFAPYGESKFVPYSNIPATTKVAIQIGEGDGNTGDGSGDLQYQAKTMHWNALNHIPCENKILLTVPNNRGLTADHLYHTMQAVNQLDFYASWKYSIGFMDCALKNKNCEYVLTNSDSIIDLGTFANKTPLKKITIVDGACKATPITSTLSQSQSEALSIRQVGHSRNIIIENSTNQLAQINIYDLTGRLLSSFGSAPGKQEIILDNVTSGFFLLNLNGHNKKIFIE